MANMQQGGNRGDFRGRRGPPGSDNRPSFRFLIPSKAASIIIGPGGDRVQRLRTEFNSRLSILDSKGPERVFQIEGSLDNCLKIWTDCLPDLKMVMSADPQRIGEEMDLRYLCHNSIVGTIIGKGGSKVKEIKSNHKLSLLKVHFEPAPKSTDRVIQIVGAPDKIVDCLRVICTDLESQTIRGPVDNYNPENCNEQMCSFYGGWGHELGTGSFMGSSHKSFDPPTMGFERSGGMDRNFETQYGGSEMDHFGSGRDVSPSMDQYGASRMNGPPMDQFGRNGGPQMDHYGGGRNGIPQMDQYGGGRIGGPPMDQYGGGGRNSGSLMNQFDRNMCNMNEYDEEACDDNSFNAYDDGKNNSAPSNQYDARGKNTIPRNNPYDPSSQFGVARMVGDRKVVPLMANYQTNPFKAPGGRSSFDGGMRRPYGDDSSNNVSKKKPRIWGDDSEGNDEFGESNTRLGDNVDIIVPGTHFGSLLGTGGEKLYNMMNDSGAAIVVLPSHCPSGDRVLNIKGTKDQIEGAQYLMQMSLKRSMLNLQ